MSTTARALLHIPSRVKMRHYTRWGPLSPDLASASPALDDFLHTVFLPGELSSLQHSRRMQSSHAQTGPFT
ncbi:hypothetical protein [Streptomyces sp. NBC_00038]|uniref:hypothetical protein n=1 Tax=Streptomyces sp. NBC_00038 TaxID=2903615 RepID=UPI0022564055|nr:hypothetical protein [Streptomyces sp. NBC_00038]MCX5559512.1 hypothetical protein [Streptomyces sp. NBC_00038]